MTLTPLQKFQNQRGNISNNVELLEKKVALGTYQNWQLSTVEKEHKLLDTWMNKLITVQDELMLLTPAGDQPAAVTEYQNIMLRINVLEESLASHPKRLAVLNTPAPPPKVMVKLPVLKLPTFDGSCDKWLQFRDSFLTNIDRRIDIEPVEKMQYLNSCLTDEALALVSNLPVSADNYTLAWSVIMKRYDKKDVLISAQFKRLFNQPKMNVECGTVLRKLIDTTTSCVETLTTLGQPTEHWDAVLIYHLTEKLDPETRRMYEMQRDSSADAKYEDLITYLNKRADSMAIIGTSKTKTHPDPRNSFVPKKKQDKNEQLNAHHTASSQSNCCVCSKDHRTYKCDQLTPLDVAEKKNLLKKNGICFNCLHKGHLSKDCTSKFTCLKCKKRHNTILHEDQPSKEVLPEDAEQKTSHLTTPLHGQSNILLATALVKVKNAEGNFMVVRALIDQGSEATFISEHCAQQLKLPKTDVNVAVSGLQGSSVGMVKYSTSVTIESCINKFSTKVNAYILPGKITRPLPTRTLSHFSWPHIQNLKLADPTFHISAPIDLLIGADVYAEILRCSGKTRILDGPIDAPLAQKSVFGWLLTGRLPSVNHRTLTVSANVTFTVEETLQKFWELEQVPTITPMTEEEKEVEKHFAQTHIRLPNGQHQVRLPFRKNCPSLGSSRHSAVQRFKQIERRMSRDPNYRKQYVDFMKEYEDLNHMRRLTPDELNLPPSECNYIPHHAVLKPESTSTKLRAVFDGSAETSSGRSLNQNLMVGPTVQNSLLTIILNFRTHVVAFTADVVKMYRIVRVHPEDCRYLRIVWRDDLSKPLEDYELLTVTYGTGPAPYLATKSLQTFTAEEVAEHPHATEIVKTDIYVDDTLSGDSTTIKAIHLKDELEALLKKACFELRKWSSNDAEFMASIPKERRGTTKSLNLDSDDSVKTLGLQWHPSTDEFSFKVVMPVRQSRATKRTLLSDTSRLFDPTGVVSPSTIFAKLLLQNLWRQSIGWDDPLPTSCDEDWNLYQQQLPELEEIRIPRCIFPSGSSRFSLHGFADASEKAYAAVVYARSINPDSSVNVFLVTGKTKVAPIKVISIPRLELCAALTLAQLIAFVKKSLRVNIEETHVWSDSTIVLDWLSGAATKQEIFVANRVSKILEVLPLNLWHHVRSEDNPADCASRGILPGDLKNHPLWWHGPSWLKENPFPISEPRLYVTPAAKDTTKVHIFHTCTDHSPIMKSKTLSVLIRSTAYWFRYFYNRKHPNEKIPTDQVVTAAERKKSLHHWILKIQQEFFSFELHSLRNKKCIQLKSRILHLNPFIDEAGLLRVGRRLSKAPISHDRRHPILLPRKSRLTQLIVINEHEVMLHASVQLLLASLQQRFWIVNGRDLVRQVVKRCIRCTRFQATNAQQIMGDLPAVRVTPCQPFLKCGVDYAGPVLLRVMRGRSAMIFKGYIAVFVCFVSRAIHLELAGDMTTETFLGVLRRFASRRGKCTDMYSDCGSNFVGATKELREFLKFTLDLERDPAVAKFQSDNGVTWHFNPPGAPHMGGLWEAGVKSMKYHLKRIVGDTRLTFEEMSTILTQIEACLNSRPLAPLSSDPNDLEALTLGHFLIGRAITSIPEPELDHLPVNRLSRWQHTQLLFQHFWKRWHNDYISTLQRRPKWLKPHANLEAGNLVLLKDDCLPPLRWKLARILKVHAGDDEKVRVVTIRIGTKTFDRPIHKLVLLPIDTSDSIPNNET